MGRSSSNESERSFHSPKDSVEVLDPLFPSVDLRNAFQKLSIKTSPEYTEDLLDDKKRLLIEVLETNKLPKEILKTNETIYISSSIDVEYLLCLGARKITLVDPSLADENVRNNLVEKIKLFDQNVQLKLTDKQMHFSFDFGQGKEDVIISLEPKIYRKEKSDHHKEAGEDDYALPSKVGMVVGYRTQDALIWDKEIKDSLVSGGAILVDAETMPISDYVDARKQIVNYQEKNDDETRKEIYMSRGYEYVPLKTNKQRGWTKSFLIKV